MKLNTPNKLVILRFVLALTVVGLLIAIPYAQDPSFFIQCADKSRSIH
jgi:hypothetical protein